MRPYRHVTHDMAWRCKGHYGFDRIGPPSLTVEFKPYIFRSGKGKID